MRFRHNRLSALPIASMLILALVTLGGCAQVEIVDATPVASTAEALSSSLLAENAVDNLAVLAVDFDPPLDYQQFSFPKRSLALLVAVENTGRNTQRDVMVRAELSSPENPRFLITQGASLASIAPGEVQVVRFSRLGEIPYHQVYRLEVTVDPVPGERDLSDNRRAFDIQIHQGEDGP
jgi:hypothetical protein